MLAVMHPPDAFILVVDDDEAIRESLVDLLEDRGHRVQVAANGRDALDIMRSSTPCMILLDLMMPVMDGWEFASLKAQDPRLSTIPICVVTAFGQSQKPPPGIACVFEKPFRATDLIASVERHC
jgi:CheY-like chemotaxis protein